MSGINQRGFATCVRNDHGNTRELKDTIRKFVTVVTNEPTIPALADLKL